MKTVKQALLIKLTELFPSECYEDRKDYLLQFSKDQVLNCLASFNRYINRIISLDISYDTQLKILFELLEGNKVIFDRIKELLKKYNAGNKIPLLFSRASFLIAIDEVRTLEFAKIQNPKPHGVYLLKYLLAINSVIANEQNKNASKKLTTIESIFSKIAPSNELFFFINPVTELLRSFALNFYLKKHHKYSKALGEFEEKIGFSYQVLNTWILDKASLREEKIHVPILYSRNEQDSKILDYFSDLDNLNQVSELEIIRTKKSPIHRSERGIFLLLDINLLVDKSYYSLVNDFFFDNKKKYNFRRDFYMAELGLFFEKHISSIIKRSFHFLKHPSPKTLDELKVRNSEGEIELADAYLRQNKRIMIAQVKVSAINSHDKYSNEDYQMILGTKENIYDKFGLYQIVSSIKKMVFNPTQFDHKISKNKKYEIYPVLIFNERILGLPIVPLMFQNEFCKNLAKELSEPSIYELDTISDIKYENFVIKPVILMHCSWLEILEPYIAQKKIDIWSFLKKYIKETKLQHNLENSLGSLIDDTYFQYVIENANNYLKNENVA